MRIQPGGGYIRGSFRVLLGALLLAAFSCCTTTHAHAAAPEVLRVVTSQMPSLAYMDDHGRPVGYCFDVFRSVCEALGVRTTVSLRSKPRYIVEFKDGKADAHPCSAAEWLPALAGEVVFSKPYHEVENVLLARRGSLAAGAGPKSFAGARVGTMAGYTYADGFDAAFTAGMLRREDTPDMQMMLRKLASGRLDAAIMGVFEMEYWLAALGYDPQDFEVVYRFSRKTPVSIVLHRRYAELMPAVDRQLERMRREGSLNRLLEAERLRLRTLVHGM